VLASQRGDIYALVPAGKALYAGFQLAENYPKASVGFSIAAFPHRRRRRRRRRHAIVAPTTCDKVSRGACRAAKRSAVATALSVEIPISELAAVWSQALAADGRNSPDDDVMPSGA